MQQNIDIGEGKSKIRIILTVTCIAEDRIYW
jgi:hypothetical protein